MNNYHANICHDLEEYISNTLNKDFTDYLGTSVTESIFFPVSYSELLNIVSKQKCKKSFDYHGLNMWIIEKIISILEPLMHIHNLFSSKGIFPQEM